MDTPPQIASLTYDPGTEGWTCNMVLYLTANGTIMGHQWNHTAWTVRQVGLGGGPPGSANFTSFAVTQGLRMYGIAGGAIHEYQFSKSSPFNWLYVTTIKVPGGIL